MIRWIVILVFVVAAAALGGLPDKIVAPGATGMNSDVDPSDLRVTDAQYLLNADVTTNPGMFRTRKGHVTYGSPFGSAISSAHGLYDELTKWKCVIGVVPSGSITEVGYLPYDTSSVIIDSIITQTDTLVGQIAHSSVYGTEVEDTIDYFWTGFTKRHDFSPCGGLGVTIASPSGAPAIVTLSHADPVTDTTIDTILVPGDTLVDTIYSEIYPGVFDTLYDTTIVIPHEEYFYYYDILSDSLLFDPRVIPLSPEAPGQLRCFAIDSMDVGGLTGTFRYAGDWAYSQEADTTSGNTVGLKSVVVQINSGVAVLTNFPRLPRTDTGGYYPSNDTTGFLLYRECVSCGGGLRLIDTIWYESDYSSPIIYVDTGLPGLETYTGNTPGTYGPSKMLFVGRDTSIGELQWDERYYFAYSYIDTILNIESPLSRISWVWPGHGYVLRFSLGYTGGYDAIRLYRSIGIDTLANATPDGNPSDIVEDGSVILYATGDWPLPGYAGRLSVAFGRFHDTSLIAGDGVVDAGGDPIIRPPNIEGCEAAFTDLDLWQDRMWGIGDPEFPSRLYFSADGEYYNWPAFNWYDIDQDDNDIIVAIEKVSVGSDEALLILKRRKAFIAYGSLPSDVEFLDGSLWGSYSGSGDVKVAILTRSVGALSRELTIKHNGRIYAVTNDLDIIRFTGTRIDTISNGVRNTVKATLVAEVAEADTAYVPTFPPGPTEDEFPAVEVNARAMINGDDVVFLNQATGVGMAYNTRSGTWSKVRYQFGSIPRGSFKYDTVSTVDLFGENNDLLYFDDLDTTFFLQSDTVISDDDETTPVCLYQSPSLGDGISLWEITSVQIDYTGSGKTITVRIIDEHADTLAATSFNTSGESSRRVGLARHAAMWPSIGIEIKETLESGSSYPASVYRITPQYRKVGKARIK